MHDDLPSVCIISWCMDQHISHIYDNTATFPKNKLYTIITTINKIFISPPGPHRRQDKTRLWEEPHGTTFTTITLRNNTTRHIWSWWLSRGFDSLIWCHWYLRAGGFLRPGVFCFLKWSTTKRFSTYFYFSMATFGVQTWTRLPYNIIWNVDIHHL